LVNFIGYKIYLNGADSHQMVQKHHFFKLLENFNDMKLCLQKGKHSNQSLQKQGDN
jgi:hypothetical protein